ncbi:hypothetical protein [Lutispora sp.]|nr:hypothetical protein [Lutispora sp.]MEA4963149.1 hypothetical protein [Lutispora sp.]
MSGIYLIVSTALIIVGLSVTFISGLPGTGFQAIGWGALQR